MLITVYAKGEADIPGNMFAAYTFPSLFTDGGFFFKNSIIAS